nr:hypothetical protein [Tanacetum cinerariifolium]
MKASLKTIPHSKGPLGEKDSEGNKPLFDMEPINPTVPEPLRTGAEYQVDKTQSTRLRYQTLPENKGKTSSKVEPDLQTLQFTIVADIQAYLISEDELAQESNEKEHVEVVVSYDDLRASIEGYYEENIDHRDQTDKLVLETMDSLDKTATDKDDPALTKKVIEDTKAYTKNSSTLTELLSLVKNFDFQGLKSSVESLQAAALRQDEHLASWAKSSNSLAWNLGPRMTTLTEEQIQAHIDKEEHIKKAAEEAKMFEMTKTEVIKVVHEEAKKIRLDPKKIISAKAGEKFKKA